MTLRFGWLVVALVVAGCSQKKPEKQLIAESQVAGLRFAVEQYKLKVGEYPTTAQGLRALREQPPDVDPLKWRGPHLNEDLPNDPWGRPYLYRYPGSHGDEPEIWSYGADALPGGTGEDADIMSWKEKKQ